MFTTNPFEDDKLHEECGIFGLWGADDAAQYVALGLHALQHRGQEAAGIVTYDGKHYHAHRAMGHVAGNFDRDDIIHKLAGRVAIGHVTKLSLVPLDRFAAIARRLADAGVAVTVLPSTDLYLMGRQQRHSVVRGVLPAHELLRAGVNCSLSTNNLLNPFTPFGDASLVRMANLYANVCHVGAAHDLRECMAMITGRSARLLRLSDYGIEVGEITEEDKYGDAPL